MMRDTSVSVTDLSLNERVINSRRSHMCASVLADAPCNLLDLLNAAIHQSITATGPELASLHLLSQTAGFFLFMILDKMMINSRLFTIKHIKILKEFIPFSSCASW